MLGFGWRMRPRHKKRKEQQQGRSATRPSFAINPMIAASAPAIDFLSPEFCPLPTGTTSPAVPLLPGSGFPIAALPSIPIDPGFSLSQAMLNQFERSPANQPLVAIIDTGVSSQNPYLNYRKISVGQDYVDGDENSLLAPGEGSEHGTFVTGLIQAINPNANLFVSRAIGSGQWADALREAVDAILQSGQPNGVVNLSLDLTQINPNGTISPRYEFTPAERAALEYARQNGVLIVTSAGNGGGVMSVLGQASQEFDNIITIGAADGLDRADYSSYGYGLDLLVPGGAIADPVLSTAGQTAGTMAGTSVATARATGAISQVWAANPALSYRQVIQIMRASATDVQTPGWDPTTGAGLLNLEKALELARATHPEPYTPLAFNTPTTWSGAGIVTPGEQAVDVDPGNTRQTAQSLGPLTPAPWTLNNRIDSTDPDDFYSFYLTEPGTIHVSLTNNSQSARIELIKASSPSPSFSSSTGTSPFQQSYYVAEPGQYFVRVTQDFNTSGTDYTLQLSTTSAVTDLGILNGAKSSNASTAFYRFTLPQNSIVTAASNYPSSSLSLDIRDTNYKLITPASSGPGTTLNAGTYYLSVAPTSNSAPSSYTVNLNATPTSRYDNAGMAFHLAQDLGTINGSQKVSDFIDPTDKFDYYSFTLDTKSSVNLNITPLSGTATLGMTLYDSNINYIAGSFGNPGPLQPITQTLNPGKYFIALNDITGSTNVNYRLEITAQTLVPNDAIGNNLAQAKDLGTLMPGTPLSAATDAIGATDTADWFRFTMGKLGNLLPTLNGLTTPVSLQLLRIEANGSLTPIETLVSGGPSNWSPAFNHLTVGNYALALTSTSPNSSPYTLQLDAVSTNVAPSQLTFNFATSYPSDQDILVTGTVFDPNGAADLDNVWISVNGQTYFVKSFTPSSTDNRVATFSVNLGKLPIGNYGWSAGATDKSREASGTTISAWPANGQTTGGIQVTAPVVQPPTPPGVQLTGVIAALYPNIGAAQRIKLGSAIAAAVQTLPGVVQQAFQGGEIRVWQSGPAMIYFNDGTTYEIPNSAPGVHFPPISPNQSLTGALTSTDSQDPARLPNRLYDDYAITGFAPGQTAYFTLTSTGFTPQLYVVNAGAGDAIAQSTTVTNGNQTTLAFTVPQTGTYAIRVTSQDLNAMGSYTLTTMPFNSSLWTAGVDANGNTYPAFTTAAQSYSVYGAPTSAVYRAGNGYIQEFYAPDGFGKYYLMLEDGASTAFLLGGDLLTYYLNNGSVSRFGYPTSGLNVDPIANFSTQYFRNGSLVAHTGQVFGYDGPSAANSAAIGLRPYGAPKYTGVSNIGTQLGQLTQTTNLRNYPWVDPTTLLDTLPGGASFQILAEVGVDDPNYSNWYLVQLNNGLTGFVVASNVQISTPGIVINNSKPTMVPQFLTGGLATVTKQPPTPLDPAASNNLKLIEAKIKDIEVYLNWLDSQIKSMNDSIYSKRKQAQVWMDEWTKNPWNFILPVQAGINNAISSYMETVQLPTYNSQKSAQSMYLNSLTVKLGALKSQSKNQVNTTSIVKGSLYGSSNQPHPEDVKQGSTRDCYFLSGLAAIAYSNPSKIKEMIIDNGNGTYTIRFYDPNTNQPIYVTVDQALPTTNGRFKYANRGIPIDQSTNILWVALIEKAFAQKNGGYDKIDLGNAAYALNQILGKKFNQISTFDETALLQSFRNGPVCLDTKQLSVNNPHLIAAHSYALIGYEDGKFLLLNPYDDNNRKVYLTIDEIRDDFDQWCANI